MKINYRVKIKGPAITSGSKFVQRGFRDREVPIADSHGDLGLPAEGGTGWSCWVSRSLWLNTGHGH